MTSLLLACNPAQANDEVTLIAVGDIAGKGPGAAQTSAVVAGLPGEVAVLGDLAYEGGSTFDFYHTYDPVWGRFKPRTHPAPGNHEYQTAGATGYFNYFGAAAGVRGKGWYGYALGAHWHAIALNSNYRAGVGVGHNSEQYAWLKADLAAHAGQHVVAYWHHPRFSTGPHGDNDGMDDIWRLLYRHRVDIVLCGHDHDYERFQPLNDVGNVDLARGITAFVVGTGGRSHTPLMRPWWPVSVVRNDRAYGVLQLLLRSNSYRWEFRSVAGESFQDRGEQTCHDVSHAVVR